MTVFRSFFHFLASLATALLLTIACAAQAQSIVNVAQASWNRGGQSFTVNSNTVTLAVTIPPPRLDTFVAVTGGSAALTFAPAQCGGEPIVLPGTGSGPTFTLGANPSASIHGGETMIVRLNSAAGNQNSTQIDDIVLVLTTPAGDRETLVVRETAIDSGEFIGAIATHAVPPSAIQGDCKLGVLANSTVSIAAMLPGSTTPLITQQLSVLADPYGLVFDSESGAPVNGARVTLIDLASGLPAQVFSEDGVTVWPSSMISGQGITDGAGNAWPMLPGEYRFPLVALGNYRLQIEPPTPYTAPSSATPAQLSHLTRPDGGPLQLVPGSYGGTITLASPAPVRVDVPLDPPGVSVGLTKTASRATARPGEAVFYTIEVSNPTGVLKRSVVVTDRPSSQLRLRPDTIRIDGMANPGAVTIAPDGQTLTVALGDIAPGAVRRITYAMSVRANSAPGQALNRADVVDSRGNSASTSLAIRIEADNLAGRMTLIGRITDGGCSVEGEHRGIPGVRLVLEDGSFAITDAEGRYHFDGLVPGTHVVQALTQTLPKGGAFVDCARSTHSAGSATSRFVIGQGGSLVVADFSAVLPEKSVVTSQIKEEIATDREAAGAEIDWFALGDRGDGFVFPDENHNPRAPAVRVVVRHRVGQKVELSLDGKPVDNIASDGTRTAPDRSYAISVWRGIPITGNKADLVAVLRNGDGREAARFVRTVHFASNPARIEMLPAQSKLVADGSTRPVVALRITDRYGRPVHAGIAGDFELDAPYESAEVLDALQQRALSGLDRRSPRWVVRGDDGIAYVELAPTMVSGKLRMRFTFADGETRRSQELETWITPGEQPWTLVGLAEGSVGAQTIADNMERTGRFDSDLGDKGRVALYAKGRVLGRFLLTAAYDSAKQRDDTRLLGAIDPRAYYTVYADGSDRRFDAASRNKLYVRVEAATFYALFGDFETGFNQTQLARYQRTMTGVKGEGHFGAVEVQAFAARSNQARRHDEIQGGGISGPYRLTSRAIIPNSEVVTIEVRDRFRSELAVSRRTLTRFVDYNIDLLAGTITFKEPILSRNETLDPQFIVIDYEIDTDAATGGEVNAGLRATWTGAKGAVRIGASALTDTGSAQGARTDLAAVDLKAKIGANTEVRAEAGVSRREGDTSQAWMVEVEHHDGQLDLLTYARSIDRDYGTGQLGNAEQGRRKFGIDARYNLSDEFALSASAWHDTSLTDAAKRTAAQFGALYRSRSTDARLGVALMRDRLDDGSSANSTVLEGAVTQRLADNRLELSAASSVALGSADSLDLPERHRFGARYSVTSWLKLTGSYEIAQGKDLDARTARAGFELAPWTGARIVTGLGQQDIAEFGKRSFAAFGLSQSLPVTQHLTIDATLDSNRTLSGFDPARLVNPDHPASSGGNLGDGATIAEDFTALTLGATWRRDDWSATLRGEWRDGELADRKGVTAGAIRQLGNGSMLGAGFSWTRADGNGGLGMSEVFDGALAAAYRPADSQLAFLAKLEFRADKVEGAIAGETAGAGRTGLTVTGDAASHRLIASLSTNWSPQGHDDQGQFNQRTEIGLFTAVRHNLDRGQGLELAGTTLLGGVDARFGIGERIEIGGKATVRHNLQDRTTDFAFGPTIGIAPAKDTLLTFGYNVRGFRDRDFSAARTTDKGFFAALRIKFDANSFDFLGL